MGTEIHIVLDARFPFSEDASVVAQKVLEEEGYFVELDTI